MTAMPKTGETLTLRSGRDYLVCSVTPYDTVLRGDDGVPSIVWTREVVDAISSGRIIRKPK